MDGRLASRPFLRHSGGVKPTVRPGSPLLRRDARHLQVGTNPGIVVRDRPGLYALLLSLDGVRDLDSVSRDARRRIPALTIDATEALAPLIEAGVVVDASPVERSPCRIEFAHDGPSSDLVRSVAPLVRSVGLTVGSDADLLVVASSGEPNRTVLADLVRCRLAHLVVVQDGDAIRIGPLVVPGRTPCVDCTDLHRASWDPTWVALIPQFGRSVPSGADPLTRQAAATEIAAACREFAESLDVRPIVSVDADRSLRIVGQPAFHPRCPCALLAAA